MSRRVLCLCLAILTVFPLLSCTKNENGAGADKNKTDTTAAVTTENPIYYEPDELPELDFNGETVTFLTPADSDDGWFEGEITVEDLMSEPINDSVYNRELYVEERLNVEIENVANSSEYTILVNTMMNAGDDTYQILSQRALRLSQMVPQGYLYNLYDVSYLDLDKPWWSQKFTEQAELMDNLFLATGSLSLSLKRFLFTVFYNKKVAEDYVDKIPELADLYSVVEDGKWTIDRMIELGSDIYVDLNGNSERDQEDFYGIGMNSGIDLDIMWSSFDIGIFSKDEDGFPYLNVDTEKLYATIEKMKKLLNHSNGCYAAGGPDTGLIELETMLASDSVLFIVDRMYGAETETLRNMQHDYGILPCPKYDESQTDYYSYAHDQYTVFAIPLTCVNLDAAGAVLEAMASYSYRDTEPAYLDMALKGKYMSDMQSRRMIDIIVNGFKVDAAWIYVETYASAFASQFRSEIALDSDSYTSKYTSLQKTLSRTLPIYKRELEDMLSDR